MIPPLICQQAIEAGIGLIAITDHNSTANIEAVKKASRGTELVVLPGMELQTVEEIHALCLFDTLDQVVEFQSIIDTSLPNLPNNIDFFGEQFIVDETGDFIRREERLLLTSVSLSIRETWEQVDRLGGLFIPAHVNRKANGLFQTLGFVPEDTPIEILEISTHISPDQARSAYPQSRPYALVQNGDAHFLEDIRGPNILVLEQPTISEIRKAVLGLDGRSHDFYNNSAQK